MFRIYTSGATKNVGLEKSRAWRMRTKEYFSDQKNVSVFVPDQYFNYDDLVPITDKQCMSYFLWQLSRSNLILVCLDNSDQSIGTGIELMKARDLNIPIVGFGCNNVYPWDLELCDVVFDTYEEAMDYIVDYFLD